MSIVLTLKRWIGVLRSPPKREQDARSAPPPVHPGAEQALDNALDEVMARFAKALEHLAR